MCAYVRVKMYESHIPNTVDLDHGPWNTAFHCDQRRAVTTPV